jgi:hypothetical protein
MEDFTFQGKVQKTGEETLKGLFSNLLILAPPFWADVVNSCWLALTKLIARHMLTKSFKKSKKNLSSTDVIQIRFGHSIYI